MSIYRLIILLLIVGCEEDPTSVINSKLSGTYYLTGYMMYDNSGCSGESVVNPDVVELTLTQSEFSYEFDDNNVTIIQLTTGVEQFNQTCEYIRVYDIFTPNCYPYPHTISSNESEFAYEIGTTSDVTVEGVTKTVSVCHKYIFIKH